MRNNINYVNRSDAIFSTLEAVCVEVHIPYSSPFIVTSIYRSPSANTQYFSMIESLIEKLNSESKEPGAQIQVFLGGCIICRSEFFDEGPTWGLQFCKICVTTN